MITESWKPVVGYENVYQVSSLGRVRSVDRTCVVRRRTPNGICTHFREDKGRVLKPYFNDDGYPVVSLSKDGVDLPYLVHVLVLTAFVGICPDGMEARHLNGKPNDPRLCNLKWGTRTENLRDKIRHGTNSRKLTKKDVSAIRRRAKTGESQRSIAQRFGLCQSSVGSIIRQEVWVL